MLFSSWLCCYGDLYAPYIASHVLVLERLQASQQTSSTRGDLYVPLCLHRYLNLVLTGIRYLQVNIFCVNRMLSFTSLPLLQQQRAPRNGSSQICQPQINDTISRLHRRYQESITFPSASQENMSQDSMTLRMSYFGKAPLHHTDFRCYLCRQILRIYGDKYYVLLLLVLNAPRRLELLLMLFGEAPILSCSDVEIVDDNHRYMRSDCAS